MTNLGKANLKHRFRVYDRLENTTLVNSVRSRTDESEKQYALRSPRNNSAWVKTRFVQAFDKMGLISLDVNIVVRYLKSRFVSKNPDVATYAGKLCVPAKNQKNSENQITSKNYLKKIA